MFQFVSLLLFYLVSFIGYFYSFIDLISSSLVSDDWFGFVSVARVSILLGLCWLQSRSGINVSFECSKRKRKKPTPSVYSWSLVLHLSVVYHVGICSLAPICQHWLSPILIRLSVRILIRLIVTAGSLHSERMCLSFLIPTRYPIIWFLFHFRLIAHFGWLTTVTRWWIISLQSFHNDRFSLSPSLPPNLPPPFHCWLNLLKLSPPPCPSSCSDPYQLPPTLPERIPLKPPVKVDASDWRMRSRMRFRNVAGCGKTAKQKIQSNQINKRSECCYLEGPRNARRWRVGSNAALEVDVVALDDGIGVEIASQFQFGARRIYRK